MCEHGRRAAHNEQQDDPNIRPRQLRNREVPWEGSRRSKLMSRRTERSYKVDGAGQLARHSAARCSTPQINDPVAQQEFTLLLRETCRPSPSATTGAVASNDHRPVPCFCPAALAEDPCTPHGRHLSSGAGAPGVYPQTQRGLASHGHPDGPGPCHSAGGRASVDPDLRPALQHAQLWVPLRKPAMSLLREQRKAQSECAKEFISRLFIHVSPTLRMSHEGERVNGARMRNKSERAPPHWLNPLGSLLSSR
jgi:hypothetical protein